MAKILIVEGASVNRRIAVASLKDEGHDVIESSTGARGLKIAESERPDLVLVDTLLPDMDGGQFVRALRSTPDIVQPQVIFRAPACIDAEGRVLANTENGFFVVKQADTEALLSVVNTALSTPKQAPGTLQSVPALHEGLWRRLVRKLYLRTEQLERLITDLHLRNHNSNKQLKVARSVVDREIQKRLWAEQELTRANPMLKDQALRDIATGLHNRRYLEESLRREESRAQRTNQAFGVMMIDIDDLKHINNMLGHTAGDAVLHALGEHMRSLTRGEDIVARYGGDEFALVMTQCPQSVVRERAEKLRQSAGQLAIEYKGRRIGAVTLSVGIGIFPDHGNSGQDVLHAADMALNRAKRLGRNRTVVGETKTGATAVPANISHAGSTGVVEAPQLGKEAHGRIGRGLG